MPELKASPRNRALGLLADALSGAKSAADTVQLPVVGGIGSLLFGDAPELVNDVAYYGPQALVRGGNAATGGIGTFTPDRRILDAAGVVPMAPGAARAAKAALNPATYRDAAVAAYGPGVVSPITAWHGSPHKFRKFDNSKMGTGEGAQAYGAGAYLADARPVAEEYAKMAYNPNRRAESADDALRLSRWAEVNKLETQKANNKTAFGDPWTDAWERRLQSARKEAESFGEPPSYLYKVDIPDEAVANMLLWDKPLSEQPEVVRKLIYGRYKAAPLMEQNFGRQLYWGMSEGKDSAERALKEAGIPGIRYLDAGSRGQGAGTMNTVVFDDSIIKILERNGVPLGLLAD